jgi:CheY-like chemotaxis protein
VEKSRRVLVVDDEPVVRLIVRGALQGAKETLEVTTVRNGRQALAEMEREGFDLIITDLGMPGMGGIELTEKARALDREVAVLWITGCGCDEVLREERRLGVYRCVDKPIEIREIRELALEALGGG